MFNTPKEVITPPLVLIGGDPGTGKTHLSLSVAKYMKTYILDTEERGNIVASKSKYKNNIQIASVNSYEEVYEAIKYINKTEKEPVAIIYDSGTDIQQFAELYYKEIAKVEKIWPKVNWAQVYDLTDNVILPLRKTPHFLIVTARSKDEYLNDVATGKKILRIYNRLPFWADIILRTQKPNVVTLEKNGFGMTQEGEFEGDLFEIINKIKKLN